MGGYGARKDVSKGIHDPLMAKVLLIRSNGRQMGIVTFDLVQMVSPRIVREARETLGISTLLEIASHDHSGPVPKDRQNPEGDPWFHSMEDKVLAALKQAQSHYAPAELSVGQASMYIGHNRRKGERRRFCHYVLAQCRSPADASGRSAHRSIALHRK